jgi:acetylornithine deacetylase/succinyl-diaminopimelate desuccinylase-like protein
MYSLLRRAATPIVEDATSFAQELVRTPSLSTDEQAVAELVHDKMAALGYDEVLRDDFGNVVGILHGRHDDPTVVLNSHMDTVPVDCTGKWDGDPFAGDIRDGKLIGLGAADCKGGLAAQIAAGAILKRSLLPLRGTLVVAATVAEEVGGSAGVRGLLGKTLPDLSLRPDAVILGEPTSLGLYYGHDGWMELDVVVEGTESFQVEDAAQAIYDGLVQEIGQIGRIAAPEEMLVAAPVMRHEGSLARASLRIQRRLAAPQGVERVRGQVHRHARLAAGAGSRVLVRVAVPEEHMTLYSGTSVPVGKVNDPWQIDPFHPRFERARQCLTAAGCAVRPGKWRLDRLGMGTAGSVIVREFGIPAFGYGPGDEDQAHRPGEFVDTNMLAEAAYGTAAIVHGLIGVPVLGWSTDEI